MLRRLATGLAGGKGVGPRANARNELRPEMRLGRRNTAEKFCKRVGCKTLGNSWVPREHRAVSRRSEIRREQKIGQRRTNRDLQDPQPMPGIEAQPRQQPSSNGKRQPYQLRYLANRQVEEFGASYPMNPRWAASISLPTATRYGPQN